ncbi:MAG: PAS domain S-box protein [Pseudomonadota bacterium]
MTQAAALPDDEAARLACLLSLQVLDSAPEPLFEQVAALAAQLCAMPMALVSLVDAQRQWFKAKVGLPGVDQTPRDLAFCAHAILGDGLMEVPDAALDPRFADNPLVTGGPRIRFYAGAPIVMPQGERLGTVCVIDQQPRQLGPLQRDALLGLARLVATALAERRQRLALRSALDASEASYQAIVEGQSELVSLASLDGTLRYVNRAYARFFGQTPAQLQGLPLTDLVEAADRAAVVAHLQRVASASAPVRGVNRMVSADGRERWVDWTNRLLPAQGGSPAVIHSVGRDITEQRQAEQRLELAEARQRLLYESTPAMLHSIDAQGRLLHVSDSWLQHLGHARAEVIGRPASDFLTPDAAHAAQDMALPELWRTGRCTEVPHQMRRHDGTVIDVLLSAVLERDAQGLPVRSLAVLQDVTERNRATASLRETSHMLQLVLDSLPARISYWDVRSHNRFANKAFLDWYAQDQAAIVDRHASAVLGTATYNRILAPITAGLAGQPGQLELVVAQPDGSRVTTDMRFIPDLRDGQVHGLFVFALDISAQRQAERDLADRENRLSLLVDGVRDYAIYMLDPQGRVATWNAGAQRSKGYSADQVLGRPYAMFFSPEDVAQDRPGLALAAAARDGRYESEGWRVRSDGSRYWAGVLLSAIRDEQQGLVGFAKITHDLTGQRQQRTFLLRVVELAPCAMLMADAQGRIVMVNALTEHTFGYSRDELLGQPVEMLVPARWRGAHAGVRQGFLAGSSARAMGAGREVCALHRNGHAFPVEIGLSAIETAEGLGTLAAVFDISERQRQQATTERALAEKETLLKEVYHRVKNNLQVVQSLLSLQHHALPAGVARDALHDSVQRVRAMAMVHEKLYQSGDLAAIRLPAYTRELMAQIAEAHGVDRSHLQLQAEIADIETGLDNAIPYGLLLTELLTNCFKHAFPDGQAGVVWVRLARHEGGALLTVQDNGVGFEAARQQPGQAGSLGLKLAEGLARQLGGQLHTHQADGTTSSALLTRL